MKRAYKIAGITLASALGIVIIAAGIAVAIIASPDKLTRILNQYAPQYVQCEMELGRASLSLFKTFPNLGVSIENVALVNPMEGSPSDTLTRVDELTVTLDVQKLLREKKIVVRQCVLENALVNIYINKEGNSNLNVFQARENTDTTVFSFDYLVDIEEVRLKNADILFTDRPGDFLIRAKGIDLDLDGKFQDNDILGELQMKVDDFYLKNYAAPFGITNVKLAFTGGLKQFEQIEGTLTLHKPDLRLKPAKPDPVNVTCPVVFNLKDLTGRFEKAQASLDKYRFYVDGDAKVTDKGLMIFDITLDSDKLDFEGLLSYLPEEVQNLLNTNGPQDWLKIAARHARVTVNPTKAPFIQLGFQADDLAAKVSGQPYPLINLDFNVLMSEDLRKKNAVERLDVERLKVQVKNSSLEVKGKLDDMSRDILFKLDAKGDVLLADVKPLLPPALQLDGRTQVGLTTNVTLGDIKKSLEDHHFNRLVGKAALEVKDCSLRLGRSDLNLKGRLAGNKGNFHLNTDLLDVKEIVDLINELNPQEEKPAETDKKAIQPFMVPTGIDITADVHTKKTVYENIDFNDLTGTIAMKDTTLFLQDIHFVNKAARMQLSALYQSARKDNLFFALDFQLSDVLIGDLLDMIPYVDSLVPMLKTFDGQCDINMAASTHLGADYLPKLPTLRGDAHIKGRNLTVNDQFTFTQITDLLGVSTQGAFRVDSLNVQFTAQDSRINLLPSQIAVGKYAAVAEGFMTPDKNLEYHISLTESPFPMRRAIKISGSLDKLKFDLERSKYPNHYTPLERNERKKFHQDLKQLLKDKKRLPKIGSLLCTLRDSNPRPAD